MITAKQVKKCGNCGHTEKAHHLHSKMYETLFANLTGKFPCKEFKPNNYSVSYSPLRNSKPNHSPQARISKKFSYCQPEGTSTLSDKGWDESGKGDIIFQIKDVKEFIKELKKEIHERVFLVYGRENDVKTVNKIINQLAGKELI